MDEKDVLCCTHPNASEMTGETLKLGVMHLAPVFDLDHRGSGRRRKAPGSFLPRR